MVKPLDDEEPCPIFCPICKFPNLTFDDTLSFKENSCCSMCTMRWVEPRKEEWKSGWRPTQELISAECERRQMRKRKTNV